MTDWAARILKDQEEIAEWETKVWDMACRAESAEAGEAAALEEVARLKVCLSACEMEIHKGHKAQLELARKHRGALEDVMRLKPLLKQAFEALEFLKLKYPEVLKFRPLMNQIEEEFTDDDH